MISVVRNTVKRFSLAILCAIVTSIYSLTDVKTLNFPGKYVVFFMLGILWFITSALWIEKNKPQQKLIFTAFSTFVYAAFSFSLPLLYERLDFPLLATFYGFICLLLIAPSPKDDRYLWQFQFSLIKKAIYAGFLSLILLLGICGILGALDYLLNFTLYKNQYLDIMIIIGSFVFPFVFMAGIPQYFDEAPIESENKWLLKLIAYICIPLISIYAMILHIYAFKIFITQELPRGKVGYLVIIFGCISILLYLIAHCFKEQSRPIQLFSKYSGWLLFVPLALLTWGLHARISEFGLTEFRYFASVLGVWIFICMIYMIAKVRSVYILGTLSVLFLGSTIGNYQKLIVYDHLHRLQTAYHKKNVKGIDDALFYLGQIRKLQDVFTLPEFAHKKPKYIRFYFKDVKTAIMKK